MDPTDDMSRHGDDERILRLIMAIRTHQNAQDRFDELACEVLGINRTDGRCMDVVDQHGRIAAGDLARSCGLSGAAITALVDRMERHGYLQRVRDDEDRRRVLIELTAGANARCHEIWGPLAAEAGAFFARYDDDELDTVLDFMTHAREFLEQNMERLRAIRDGQRADTPADMR